MFTDSRRPRPRSGGRRRARPRGSGSPASGVDRTAQEVPPPTGRDTTRPARPRGPHATEDDQPMTDPKTNAPIASRVPEGHRQDRRGLGPGRRRHPGGPRRRGQHDPGRPGRLRRPGHRRGGQRPVGQVGPIKLVAMADVFEDRLGLQLQRAREGVQRPDRRARGPQVHRLRRLQEGDGLPQARRRRHPDHPAGLPLGPLHLRDREGPEHLHGEAGHRRRADHPEDARAGRRRPTRRTSRSASA